MDGTQALVVSVMLMAALIVLLRAYLVVLERRQERSSSSETEGPKPLIPIPGKQWSPEEIVERYTKMLKMIRFWGLIFLAIGVFKTGVEVYSVLSRGIVSVIPIEEIIFIGAGTLAVAWPEPVMYGVLAFANLLQNIPNFTNPQQSLQSTSNIIDLALAAALFSIFYSAAVTKQRYEALPDDLQVAEMPNRAEGIFPTAGLLLGVASMGIRASSWALTAINISLTPMQMVFLMGVAVAFGILGFAISLSSVVMQFKRIWLSLVGVFTSGITVMNWVILCSFTT